MREAIIKAIDGERDVQRKLWGGKHGWGRGDCSHPQLARPVKATVLAEECGEVAQAALDGDLDALRHELVQVAAVAVAWLEGLE